MKIIVLIAIAICTVSSLQACVTYNPSTGTYVVDNYGFVDMNAKKHKKFNPTIDSAPSRDRSKKIAKKKNN